MEELNQEQIDQLSKEQSKALLWIQSKLETVEKLESEIESLKCIVKNLVQITDNATMFASYRKTDAYGKIKTEIGKFA